MRREKGSLGQLLASGLCMLAMTALMAAYLDNVEIVEDKMEAAQLARRYILRMETVGYLTPEDERELTKELESLGITEIDFPGTTLSELSYGETIILHITGKIKGEYAFEEKRASTAKN